MELGLGAGNMKVVFVATEDCLNLDNCPLCFTDYGCDGDEDDGY